MVEHIWSIWRKMKSDDRYLYKECGICGDVRIKPDDRGWTDAQRKRLMVLAERFYATPTKRNSKTNKLDRKG